MAARMDTIVVQGDIPTNVTGRWERGLLAALRRPGGKMRPIALTEAKAKLAEGVMNRAVFKNLINIFHTTQFSGRTPGGAEAVIGALRQKVMEDPGAQWRAQISAMRMAACRDSVRWKLCGFTAHRCWEYCARSGKAEKPQHGCKQRTLNRVERGARHVATRACCQPLFLPRAQPSRKQGRRPRMDKTTRRERR